MIWFGFPNDDVADDLQVFVEIPAIPLPNGRLVVRCLVGRGQLGLFVRFHIRLLVRLHVRFRVFRRGNGWGRRRASFTRGLGFGFPFGQLDVSRHNLHNLEAVGPASATAFLFLSMSVTAETASSHAATFLTTIEVRVTLDH